jgi:hypothetical protein
VPSIVCPCHCNFGSHRLDASEVLVKFSEKIHISLMALNELCFAFQELVVYMFVFSWLYFGGPIQILHTCFSSFFWVIEVFSDMI